MLNPRSIYTPVLVGDEKITKTSYTSKSRGLVLDEAVPYIELHIVPFAHEVAREHVNKVRVIESLAQIAHYVDLRSQFYKPEYAIGFTHQKVGQIAARAFNFDLLTDLPTSSYPDDVIELFETEYQAAPCMVMMPVDQLQEMYQFDRAFESTQLAAERANLVDSLVVKANLAIAEYEKGPVWGL